MLENALQQAQVVYLFLLLLVVALAALARKLQTPYPIVLVLAGLALSFVPGIPKISLDPQVIFFVVLPPLVYSAAWLTSWREFKYHLSSIASLAIGLVAFTVFGVAAAVSWVFAGFDWRVGFVLGGCADQSTTTADTTTQTRAPIGPETFGSAPMGNSPPSVPRTINK